MDVQLAELSERSGVTIPSIKYYLREGLLPAGEREGRSRAAYGEAHVERLRLIRALVEAGRLPLTRVREVLDTLDAEPGSAHEVFGVALAATRGGEPQDTARAERILSRLDWHIELDCSPVAELASALAALDDAGLELSDDHLVELARRLHPVAEWEIDSIPLDSPAEALRYVVLGTVLVRPVLAALRELAHQDASARRLGPLRDSGS